MTEWSGELVSHPAIVQNGGSDSRRPAMRPSLPRGFGDCDTYKNVAVTGRRNVKQTGIWSEIGRLTGPTEKAIIIKVGLNR